MDSYAPNQKITDIIFAEAPDRKKKKNIKLLVIRVRTDIAVFASLSKDRDLGPRLQLVKKMECGLVHGQECKMECGLVHGQECKMECGLVHG